MKWGLRKLANIVRVDAVWSASKNWDEDAVIPFCHIREVLTDPVQDFFLFAGKDQFIILLRE